MTDKGYRKKNYSVSLRILYLRIKNDIANLILINAYAPTEG